MIISKEALDEEGRNRSRGDGYRWRRAKENGKGTKAGSAPARNRDSAYIHLGSERGDEKQFQSGEVESFSEHSSPLPSPYYWLIFLSFSSSSRATIAGVHRYLARSFARASSHV